MHTNEPNRSATCLYWTKFTSWAGHKVANRSIVRSFKSIRSSAGKHWPMADSRVMISCPMLTVRANRRTDGQVSRPEQREACISLSGDEAGRRGRRLSLSQELGVRAKCAAHSSFLAAHLDQSSLVGEHNSTGNSKSNVFFRSLLAGTIMSNTWTSIISLTSLSWPRHNKMIINQ